MTRIVKRDAAVPPNYADAMGLRFIDNRKVKGLGDSDRPALAFTFDSDSSSRHGRFDVGREELTSVVKTLRDCDGQRILPF